MSRGTIHNKNTIEEFRECDKTELLRVEGDLIARAIKSGDWIRDPLLLNRFLVISYSDLKKYNFYYCFGFPTPIYGNVTVAEDESPIVLNVTELIEATKDDPANSPFSIFIRDNATNEMRRKSIQDLIKTDDREGNFKDADLTTTYFAFSDPATGDKPGWPLRIFIAALLNSRLKSIIIFITIS